MRRASGFWERLESRLLWSGTTTAGWSDVIDADGSNLLVSNVTGQKVLLPKPAADGSVSILGSDDPDTISVQRVMSLPAAASDTINQRVYFSTSEGVFGLALPYVNDAAAFQSLVAGEAKSLADAKQHQADLISQNADDTTLNKANSQVIRAQDGVDRLAAIEAVMDETSSYLLYKMDGVYEIYVAMAGGVKDTARIRIDAAGGNDVVAVSMNVPLKASLSGGSGADKLTSGAKRSILYGGGGADRLFSRSRSGGTLDGGKGADRYYNRFGEVEILGRNDGDALIIGDKPVSVKVGGTFGVATSNLTGINTSSSSDSTLHYYFFAATDVDRIDDLLS